MAMLQTEQTQSGNGTCNNSSDITLLRQNEQSFDIVVTFSCPTFTEFICIQDLHLSNVAGSVTVPKINLSKYITG